MSNNKFAMLLESSFFDKGSVKGLLISFVTNWISLRFSLHCMLSHLNGEKCL